MLVLLCSSSSSCVSVSGSHAQSEHMHQQLGTLTHHLQEVTLMRFNKRCCQDVYPIGNLL
jgi:hypothetical protein